MISFVYNHLVYFSKRFSRAGLYEWLDRHIKDVAPGSKVLNIGSGGKVYQTLKQYNHYQVLQLDIDPVREPDIVCDACKMDVVADASVDAVCVMEVIEHIQTPHLAIDEIHRVLKPGGRLILSAPLIYPLHDEPHDYYRFTKYGLAYLLRSFSNVQIRERNDYIHSMIVLCGRTMIAPGKSNRIISMTIFVLTMLAYPLWWLLSKLYKSDSATTGYLVYATR